MPERFDAFNAKLQAAGMSQIKDVVMTVVLAATYIVNPAVVGSRLNDLFNSMLQPFKDEDLARQLTQDSGCDAWGTPRLKTGRLAAPNLKILKMLPRQHFEAAKL